MDQGSGHSLAECWLGSQYLRAHLGKGLLPSAGGGCQIRFLWVVGLRASVPCGGAPAAWQLCQQSIRPEKATERVLGRWEGRMFCYLIMNAASSHRYCIFVVITKSLGPAHRRL